MDLDILPRSVRYRLKDVIDEVRLPSFSTLRYISIVIIMAAGLTPLSWIALCITRQMAPG